MTTCIVISTVWIPFWLTPPLDRFASFIYLMLFLSWIPIVWIAYHRIAFDKWLIALILLCSIASVSMFRDSHVTRLFACSIYAKDIVWCETKDHKVFRFQPITIGETKLPIAYYVDYTYYTY